jgi:excisionase family DNA binding protein
MTIALLTPEEAALRLHVCTKVLRRLRDRGLIRYVAVTDRKIRYRPEDVDAYLESRLRMAEQPPQPNKGPSRPRRGRGNGCEIIPFSARQQGRA